MKASFSDQLRLLELARLDRDVSAAETARRHPPQTARVQELLAQRQAQSTELTGLLAARDDAQTELSRLETDVALVDARVARDRQLLATSSNAKEVQGLEHELGSLAKRKSDLEDLELEIMERLEAAEASVAAQQALIAATNDEGARLSAEGKAAVAEATARQEAAARDRAAVAAALPADLVAQYDKLSAGSAGAGLLRRRTCEGCNMVLSGTDLQTVRQAAEDDVVFCPECGCILVRTDESGL
ncbi:C4-type zinc ribbon domain-containing protein [Microbacterium sp. W1N]|uniref:zinc ribbon domain-containing protein n=1 Tax=Microbacterium festucae TaxID=2977531 RepID=UPI0021BF1EEE|nr:C4-type zinc ribbon domain-containing protein [Microbacterium festucae]MCT9820046.1 C4-type zinc ribbon domain-containing protein [Microbacterium festucae]